MEIKEFKAMVKEHEARQIFCCVYENKVERIYRKTDDAGHKEYFIDTLVMDGMNVTESVYPIAPSKMTELRDTSNMQKAAFQKNREQTEQTVNECRIKHGGFVKEHLTMEQKRFYKIKAAALTLMLSAGDDREQN